MPNRAAVRFETRVVLRVSQACAFFLMLCALGVARAEVVLSFDFARQSAPWMALGDGGRLEVSRDLVDGGARKPTLAYRYDLSRGGLQFLTLPVTPGALAAAGTLTFQARTSDLTSVVVVMEEQGGGRWTAAVSLPAGRWTPVKLLASDFVLAADAGDPPDANGRLDMDKVKQVSLTDAATFVAASPDAMRFFGIEARSRMLQLADVSFSSPDAKLAPPTTLSLDGFTSPQPMWILFGATAFDYDVIAPLRSRGLVASYERKPGSAIGLMRRIPRGLLTNLTTLRIALASAAKTTLHVKVEQANGGKFEMPLEVPGDSLVHDHSLRGTEFKRSDDSRRGVDRLDWSEVTQIILLDAGGGLFSARGANRLWLAGLSSDATAGASARAPATGNPSATPARPAPAVATTSVATPGWSTWTKRIEPVHKGPLSVVGDPSVMRDGAILRMIYNCFDPARKRGAICQATSADGIAWTDVPNGDGLPGRMIKTRPGQWDDAQETPFMIKFNGEYLLYFIGYRDRGGFFKSFPAHVGFAVSRNGVDFERPILEPVVQTTPGGYDNDSISSPSVVEYQGKLVMLYTGYCFTNCPLGKGMTLMSATSTDGRVWVKNAKPVLTRADFPTVKDGIAETELDRGPDGQYYLFFSMFYGDSGHEIGVARAPTPFGPWDIDPEPIVRKSKDGFDSVGPIAPTVVFEGDRVRMWFHGFSSHQTIEIGYAEAPWPLRLK